MSHGSSRGVAGVRVTLGPYSADTDKAGLYTFANVPRGEYDLSLEPHLLPADVAWDGRSEHLNIRSTAAVHVTLKVTPLNAIHGRVYVDRNGNGRYDSGEAVAGAAVRAGDRVTSSDASGAYSFYNLSPGAHVIALASVPPAFEQTASIRTVTLMDDRPATGQDFLVVSKQKPILWEGRPQ